MTCPSSFWYYLVITCTNEFYQRGHPKILAEKEMSRFKFSGFARKKIGKEGLDKSFWFRFDSPEVKWYLLLTMKTFASRVVKQKI